ncbi:MAG: hypothetical protein WCR07_11685 [Verrucomicrobiota bacterium]|jgi:hypothetical protein
MNFRNITTGLLASSLALAGLHGADLVATVATNRYVLKADQPGQQVRLFLENRSTQSYTVLAGTFMFVMAPTSPGAPSPAPRIAKARMLGLESSPLVESRLMQTDYPAPQGAWMSTLEALSFLPSRRVVIPPGSHWPLCDLELDTTGVKDGSVAWQVRLDGDAAGTRAKSFFNVPSTVDPKLTQEVPVEAGSVEIRVESMSLPVPPPLAIGFGGNNGSLVFEADAGAGAAPAIEFADDPVNGTWRHVAAVGSQVGAKWRWELAVDPHAPTRFFRTANAAKSGGSGSGTGPAE